MFYNGQTINSTYVDPKKICIISSYSIVQSQIVSDTRYNIQCSKIKSYESTTSNPTCEIMGGGHALLACGFQSIYHTCMASSAKNKSFCEVLKYVKNTRPHCPKLMKFMDVLPK